MTTFNAPRVQDSLVASVFGETQAIVHAIVDAFAASGAVCRVDHADPNLKLNISVPVRGDFGLVDVRFACIGPPRLRNHCVAMEVPARLTSPGARIELREALKASLAWVREHRGLESSWRADAPLIEPDDGLILAYAPAGGSPQDSRPMLSAGAALVADATAAQLAPFKHGAAAAARQESVSAAVLDVLTREPEASVLPALATRVVDGTEAETSAAPAERPASAGTPLVTLRSAPTSGTLSDDAPGEEDLAHALPRDLFRVPTPAASPSPPASPSLEESDARTPSLASTTGLFAETSEHIRGCLESVHDRPTPAATMSPRDAVPSLRPLASAVEAGGAASTSALATASRLILAQPIGSTRAVVRAALDEAGVPRAAWELLARLGAHHAAEEAKAGGHAATRTPAVAGRVMQEAAGQLGLSPSGLCIALQGALVLGPQSAAGSAGGAAAETSPSSRAATVHAVRQAANRWAILPESDNVAMVQIQRSATELADALDSEEGMLEQP